MAFPPGPVFQVIEGQVTFYERDDPTCTPKVVSKGQGYVDTGKGHIGRNESGAPAQGRLCYPCSGRKTISRRSWKRPRLSASSEGGDLSFFAFTRALGRAPSEPRSSHRDRLGSMPLASAVRLAYAALFDRESAGKAWSEGLPQSCRRRGRLQPPHGRGRGRHARAAEELPPRTDRPRDRRFHGRIIKLMGDGALVEFASVVDAVQCAAAIQRRMAERDQGVRRSAADPVSHRRQSRRRHRRRQRYLWRRRKHRRAPRGDGRARRDLHLRHGVRSRGAQGGCRLCRPRASSASRISPIRFAPIGVLLDPAESGKVVAAPRRPARAS